MNKKILSKIAISVLAVSPSFAYAATAMVGTILTQIQNLLNTIIPILMILATVVFLWGVILYVVAGGDEEKLKTAKRFIILGLIGLFVMVAVWGVVKALTTTFGLGGEGTPTGPTGNGILPGTF